MTTNQRENAFEHKSPYIFSTNTIFGTHEKYAIMDFQTIPCGAYAQAQILNETAVDLSEAGEYDRALSVLTKALQMWKSYRSEDEGEAICLCSRCHCQSKGEMQCMEIDHQEIDSCSALSSIAKSGQQDTETEYPVAVEHGYVYQELIRIPCRKIFEASNFCSAVVLILLINLAIVQHLHACTSNNKKRMGKTLRLYQLSNDCLNSYVNDTNSCAQKAGAFELGMIIQIILINNLSHLHSIMGNRLTSVHCTKTLIPVLMCVVDDKARNKNYDSEFSRDVWHVSLEGFFRNISPLVLTSQCADAA